MNKYEQDYIRKIAKQLREAYYNALGMIDCYKKEYYERVMNACSEALEKLVDDEE